VLALGGKHAAVVAADADAERAARGIAWGALANCGQNCGAVERVFVDERIATRFLEHLLAIVDTLRVGTPLDTAVDLGPLVSDERRQEVHLQVVEAESRGARILRGGTLPQCDGWFYPPTVVLGPPLDCRLMRDETLGPVIPVVVVENLERAILLANDSRYALTASGWTSSSECAERMLVGLEAGVVTINDVLYSFGEPGATWSGYRRSGVGQNHGTPGLREMCRQRFVSYDELPVEAPLFSFPYDDTAQRMTNAIIDHLHGPSRSRRLGGLMRLAFSRRFRARVPFRSFLLRRGRRR
jgi:acyl-CoA reductase-like NAD-dependent aldehyde dehydrogenase